MTAASLPTRTTRKQRAEALTTVTDERLAEMIQATDKHARDSQSILAALRREQRRRHKARSAARP